MPVLSGLLQVVQWVFQVPSSVQVGSSVVVFLLSVWSGAIIISVRALLHFVQLYCILPFSVHVAGMMMVPLSQ